MHLSFCLIFDQNSLVIVFQEKTLELGWVATFRIISLSIANFQKNAQLSFIGSSSYSHFVDHLACADLKNVRSFACLSFCCSARFMLLLLIIPKIVVSEAADHIQSVIFGLWLLSLCLLPVPCLDLLCFVSAKSYQALLLIYSLSNLVLRKLIISHKFCRIWIRF